MAAGADDVAAMVVAARRLFQALRQGLANDEPADEMSARMRGLHSEYEVLWSQVRKCAEALDRSPQLHAPPTGPAAAGDANEIRTLQEERQRLRHLLAARNHDLKQQIDMLRQLLCDCQLMGV